jgi:hypothetical protein
MTVVHFITYSDVPQKSIIRASLFGLIFPHIRHVHCETPQPISKPTTGNVRRIENVVLLLLMSVMLFWNNGEPVLLKFFKQCDSEGTGSFAVFYLIQKYSCNCWVYGIFPTSRTLKNTTIRKLDLFPSSGDGVGDTHSVGSDEKI